MSQRPKRVYLHVGVPKSGTTFLQATLAHNRAALLEDGVLYPRDEHDVMFRAALDVRGNHKRWGLRRAEVKGTWDHLCRRAREHEGTTVLSHELLAAAGSRQVAAAMTMLTGLEVHVVVTARDPGRQATAEWQEGIKHGRTLTFETFRERVLTGDASHGYARRFADAQDLPEVLARWGEALPADRVHVVCGPPRGADPQDLWRLFAGAVGVDPERYETADAMAANASLGVAEIDLLRRVNLALDQRLVQPAYGRVVKRYFAQQLLAARESDRPRLPEDLYDDLVPVGERWVKEIDRAGYSVHGDLQQLVPTPPAEPSPHPDDVDPRAQVATAAAAIAELLVELERTQGRVEQLASDKRTLKKKRKKLKRRLAEALAPH